MLALGLMPAGAAGRDVPSRVQGALRLLKLQGLAFAAQVAALLAAMVLA